MDSFALEVARIESFIHLLLSNLSFAYRFYPRHETYRVMQVDQGAKGRYSLYATEPTKILSSPHPLLCIIMLKHLL